ncbi:MAG: hypothetical protein LBV50_05485 [Novosphingobium sp.]|jgi:hypothetical protein|nr:hypothetical protein [Novosphingobium sp.]
MLARTTAFQQRTHGKDMTTSLTRDALAYPLFPPGFWRRIVLYPGGHSSIGGWIGAALEDDMHRFHIRIDHVEGRIAAVAARAMRHPWSACPGAAGFIAGDLTGELLADVARRDPSQHCTHLYDLAILAAAHAGDTAPTRYDMKVADRVEDRTTATLAENEVEKLRWQLVGTAIAGTDRNLRQLSGWKQELPPREAEWTTLLRRAVFVSGARQYRAPSLAETATMNRGRMGVCYNYQMPQAETSTRTPDWHRDFSETGHEPLADLDAEGEFRAMGEQA